MTITVPDGLWDKYYEAGDFFIEQFGRDCTVIYPPKRTQCINCVNPIGMDHNVYRHGGPAPFSFGDCPLCGGSGYKESEATDIIRLRIYWSRSDWIRVAGNIHDEESEILVIGYMSDIEKVKQAIYIVLSHNNNESRYRSTIVGKPLPWGFNKNRYFSVFMK